MTGWSAIAWLRINLSLSALGAEVPPDGSRDETHKPAGARAVGSSTNQQGIAEARATAHVAKEATSVKVNGPAPRSKQLTESPQA
ncbi:hypothetical protein DHEL01_v202010 [Diaporthe helianthi]|uniref:Secreted protein n=1 Tax=Diaporthe helianthi TaxID=158607 RepID=A0A2P5IAP3_DIAHE|nr:hypothetical protein DHEL01_v202010 [Diaporthe helianthi]